MVQFLHQYWRYYFPVYSTFSTYFTLRNTVICELFFKAMKSVETRLQRVAFKLQQITEDNKLKIAIVTYSLSFGLSKNIRNKCLVRSDLVLDKVIILFLSYFNRLGYLRLYLQENMNIKLKIFQRVCKFERKH